MGVPGYSLFGSIAGCRKSHQNSSSRTVVNAKPSEREIRGRPQFYVTAETLEDLLGLRFLMAKISRMFDVSQSYCTVTLYSGLQNTMQFSFFSDAEYMGRHGFTTGRTYLGGCLKSVGLRVQRRRIRDCVGKGGSGKYCLEVGHCCFS